MVAGRRIGRRGSKAANGRDFSVILGTRRHAAENNAPPNPAEEDREPETARTGGGRQKEYTLGDLSKKRQQLDLYLTSLEDAHRSARFPEYTYARLKRKYENEISAIDKMLKKKHPRAPKPQPPGPAPARRPDERPEKAGREKAPPAAPAPPPRPPEAKEAAARAHAGDVGAEGLEKIMLRVPVLKNQINAMKRRMSHYIRSLRELRDHEKSFESDLSDIRKSLNALRSEIAEGAGAVIAQGDASGKAAEGVNRKLDEVSKRLSAICSSLSSRIDQLSVIEEFETAGHFRELGKEMEQLRSQLSGCVRREELGGLRGRVPAAPPAPAEAPRKAARARPAAEQATVRISGLRAHIGEAVKVMCSIEPLRKLDERNVAIFWYSIRDPSGEGILTSYREIKEKRGVVSGTVKLTRTGSLYILFKGMA